MNWMEPVAFLLYYFRSSLTLTWLLFRFQKQPPEVFYKKRCYNNFAIFTGKLLCCYLFLIRLQAYNFIKKRLQHTCFLDE